MMIFTLPYNNDATITLQSLTKVESIPLRQGQLKPIVHDVIDEKALQLLKAFKDERLHPKLAFRSYLPNKFMSTLNNEAAKQMEDPEIREYREFAIQKISFIDKFGENVALLLEDNPDIWILNEEDLLLDHTNDRGRVGIQSEIIIGNIRKLTFVVFISTFMIWIKLDYQTVPHKGFNPKRAYKKGGFGEIHLVKEGEDKFCYKLIRFESQNNKTQPRYQIIQQAIRECAFNKLFSALQIGPKHSKLKGRADQNESQYQVDIIVYENCIIFKMKFCYTLEHLLAINLKEQVRSELCKRIENDISEHILRHHSYNIVHQDLSPKNIVYDKSAEQFKLIDFGLAHSIKQLLNQKTKNYIPGGTPNYCSPSMEIQLKNKGKDREEISLHYNDYYGLKASVNRFQKMCKLKYQAQKTDAISYQQIMNHYIEFSNQDPFKDERKRLRYLTDIHGDSLETQLLSRRVFNPEELKEFSQKKTQIKRGKIFKDWRRSFEQIKKSRFNQLEFTLEDIFQVLSQLEKDENGSQKNKPDYEIVLKCLMKIKLSHSTLDIDFQLLSQFLRDICQKLMRKYELNRFYSEYYRVLFSFILWCERVQQMSGEEIKKQVNNSIIPKYRRLLNIIKEYSLQIEPSQEKKMLKMMDDLSIYFSHFNIMEICEIIIEFRAKMPFCQPDDTFYLIIRCICQHLYHQDSLDKIQSLLDHLTNLARQIIDKNRHFDYLTKIFFIYLLTQLYNSGYLIQVTEDLGKQGTNSIVTYCSGLLSIINQLQNHKQSGALRQSLMNTLNETLFHYLSKMRSMTRLLQEMKSDNYSFNIIKNQFDKFFGFMKNIDLQKLANKKDPFWLTKIIDNKQWKDLSSQKKIKFLEDYKMKLDIKQIISLSKKNVNQSRRSLYAFQTLLKINQQKDAKHLKNLISIGQSRSITPLDQNTQEMYIQQLDSSHTFPIINSNTSRFSYDAKRNQVTKNAGKYSSS